MNICISSQFLKIAHFPQELLLRTLIVVLINSRSDNAKIPAIAGSHSDACSVCSDCGFLVAGGANQTTRSDRS